MALDRINATALLDGGVATADIADDAVTTAKIAADAVTTAKIAAGAVDTTELASGAVTSAKLDTNIDIAGDLTVDTNTLHVDSANNRVGVGKLSPDTAFHVESTSQLPQAKVSYDSTRSISFGHSSIIQTSGAAQDNPFSIHSRGFHSGTGNVIKFFTGGQSDGTGETEKLRILPNGGITFNGDTATANALDDYEEGTWTPSSPTVTFTGEGGTYTKIGREVFFEATFTVPSNSSGVQFLVDGVPFTPNATTGGGSYLRYSNNGSAIFLTLAGGQTRMYGYDLSGNTITLASVSGKRFDIIGKFYV